uniref:Integration host factor subunit beta n=1 Tax=Candidatus Kentrum sp. TC TaxID=2126339 RepID=A0A451A1J0_9GAMM|nr:MAG: integration host factor subunit beta [Candidatus Kentron sp. TC]
MPWKQPPTMNKPDLIHRMAASMENTGHEDARIMVDIILVSIADALAAGERVEIRGFGSFGVRYHEPRIGRNPKTGERVDIFGRYVPYFKPGKELRQRVDETGSRD